MNYIIILFATVTIAAGIIIVINPETIFGLLRRKSESLNLHILAVFVRVILGVALIAMLTKYRLRLKALLGLASKVERLWPELFRLRT